MFGMDNEEILHDVGGVKKLTFHLAEGASDTAFAVAECGIGVLHIASAGKPNVPFISGVVLIDNEKTGETLCDDVQLVASFVHAYRGYARVATLDGKKNPRYLPDEPEWDWNTSWPNGDVKILTPDEAHEYLVARHIPVPGLPI